MNDLSKPVEKEIICKKCNKSGIFKMYPIINFNDKELTEKTFTLELFNYKCPNCGAITLVQYDTIIIDMYKQNLIYLYANEDIDKFYKEILPNLNKILQQNKEYETLINNLKHTRLVQNLHELLEKLLIFDYDLDDRVIEIIKYSLMQRKDLQEFECITMFFEKLEKEKLLFSCISKNKNNKPKGIAIDFTYYNKIIDDTKIKPESKNFSFNKIDDSLINFLINKNK